MLKMSLLNSFWFFLISLSINDLSSSDIPFPVGFHLDLVKLFYTKAIVSGLLLLKHY